MLTTCVTQVDANQREIVDALRKVRAGLITLGEPMAEDWQRINRYCKERGKHRISKHILADGRSVYYAWDGVNEYFKPYATAQEAIDAIDQQRIPRRDRGSLQSEGAD